MSLETNSLLFAVKRAALEAVNASKPFALSFGKVVSVNPLKITIDQKLTLTPAQLILTNAVRDFTVDISMNFSTGSALAAEGYGHTHKLSGTKSVRVMLGLKTGEQVILLRANGGQKYIVLDRVEAPA